MNVTVNELEMLIGQKEIELFALRKQVTLLEARISELEPKPEPAPLKAVP
jgi:hypothetical protein